MTQSTNNASPVGLTLAMKPQESFAETVGRYLSMDSRVVEIPYRLPFAGTSCRLSDLSGRALRQIKAQTARFDRLSFHAPLGNTLLTNPEIQRAILTSLRQAVQEAALIGAQAIALHIEPMYPNLAFSEHILYKSAEILRDLAEYAACYGVQLGLETEYPYTLTDFLGLIDAVDHTHFGATVDVGHLYDRRVPHHTYIDRDLLRSAAGPAAYNSLLQELTAALLQRDKLFHVHIHQQRVEALGDDWTYSPSDHFTLDKGFIAIPRFLQQLRHGGYGGIIICEVVRGNNYPQEPVITDAEKLASLRLAQKWWNEAKPEPTECTSLC
ncbi:MAG TPA: TIM barrel protein [Firmicutes bacterium]|nr:TIM barrel protein [Bacillota bacterium]